MRISDLSSDVCSSDLGVPVLEYPALARALYYTSQENQEIRDDLYMAIATVLAFVFNLNLQAVGTPPLVTVPPGARFDENGVSLGSIVAPAPFSTPHPPTGS